MADEFNPRKPKNSCDVNDRWNAPEWATNAGTSFGSSNLDIFAQPNRNFTDQFQKEIPICWDRASARFGTAALLAEKSPFTPKTRSLIQCSVAPLDNTSLASLFFVGLGHVFAFSRHIKDFKIDGTEWSSGKPQKDLHNSLYEVSFYLPEKGIIKFKVFVDKDGKITPALNEARNFLDKAVPANQPNASDFAIEASAENLNQLVLKSGSIQYTVNLEFAQDAVPPKKPEDPVSYYNQRVIPAKSQPSSPLKIGDEKESARFASQKKSVRPFVLLRQILELPYIKRTNNIAATRDNPARADIYFSSPGKVHSIMLSDGNMAVINEMGKDEKGYEPSFLYIPNHETGEIKQVELIDTGKGLVAEGYANGFKFDRKYAIKSFVLVDRKEIEPENIDLQQKLTALEAEARDDSYSLENQYINKFRRAVIATFIGNEHLLSGSDLLTQLGRRHGETLDTWRVRAYRVLEAFAVRTNEFKVAGNGYSTSDAPKKFYDAELNPPQPKTKPGEPAPKPNLCSLLQTRLSDSDLRERIDGIPEPRSLVIERKGKTDLSKPKRGRPEIDDDELRALSEPPTEAEEASLASLIDRGEQTGRQTRARRGALPATGAGEPSMSTPPIPPAVTPSVSPELAINKLVERFTPTYPPTKARTVKAYSKFGDETGLTDVTVEHLGMDVKNDTSSDQCFKLSIQNGPTIYLVLNKKASGKQMIYAPLQALVDGISADSLEKLKRTERGLIILKSGILTFQTDPFLFHAMITNVPYREDVQLISISGSTPKASVLPPPPPLVSSPDEPISIDPSLKLQAQTAFADYDVREEVVEIVANRFGISIDSIWDLAGPAHRGMSLDQITQTGNHFAYQRAGSQLQIEFDRTSTNPHFADVANLKITYDGQPIPFEYTVEHGRPYLFLKGGLHGVVFYLSPNADGSYAMTEATHPVLREQAERDMGYIAAPRPDNIPYPSIREKFSLLISFERTPDEQMMTEQIYRNRLWKLKEAGVLPEDLKEQLLIAKRLEVYFSDFDRRNVESYSLLHTFEEMVKEEKLKIKVREVLQKLALNPDRHGTLKILDRMYHTDWLDTTGLAEQVFLTLDQLSKELDPESGHKEASEPTPPTDQTFGPERVVSEESSPPTPLVCEAPPPADQTIEPLVSTQPPPTLLIRALQSLGETGQRLINALFPSEADAATKPILEDADVRDGFLGIARFFGIPDEQLTALLSPNSAETQTTEISQASVTPTSTPDPESEPICREPEQPKDQSVPSDKVDGEAKSEGFKEEEELVCREKPEDQSVPSDKVGEKANSEGFNEDDFRRELAIHRGDVNARFNPKHHQENLAKAISYIKGSGATEVKDFVLAIEASLPAENHEQEKVLWDFLGRVVRYQFNYKPIRHHVIGALGRTISDMSKRLEKLEELETFIRNNEEEKREAEKERRSEKVAP